MAVSNKKEKDNKFFIVEGWTGASSLLKPKKEPGVKWTMEKKIVETLVDVTTIDDFIKENNIDKVDVVWMDIQGNELRALKGMKECLDKIKIIQTEAGVREYYENHTLFHDIEKFLKVVFPWIFILGKTRRVKSHRPVATINLNSKWNIDRERYRDESSQVAFAITTHDLDRIEDISKRNGEEAEIKGAIYRGKIYPIKSGNKDLV